MTHSVPAIDQMTMATAAAITHVFQADVFQENMNHGAIPATYTKYAMISHSDERSRRTFHSRISFSYRGAQKYFGCFSFFPHNA